MFRCHHAYLYLLVCTMTLGFLIHSATVAAGSGPWEGKVRPGFMTGNSDVGTDGYFDILLPLYGDKQRLFFFNPNFRFDDNDGNEQNVGFGYRRLGSGGRFIAGGNVYYDTMESSTGHRYEQWGLGAELLTHWVDLRANYYDVFGDEENVLGGSPGSGSFTFSGNSLVINSGLDVEEALDGFDAEVSFLVPGVSDFMETRVAGTYYSFDAHYGKDPDGWRGRLEIRPVQAVNLSIEYRDDSLRNDDTFFGGYLEIPFSMGNLFSGRNPFAGAGDSWAFGQGVRELEQRMTDKVVRDRHIVAVRTETLETETVVDDTIIFVSQDNQAVGEGSYENPYHSLNDVPVDERYAPGAWIYVFSSDKEGDVDTYGVVNFTLLDDMVFWGEGYQHPVYGLGGGNNPILDGMSTPEKSIITLANNNEIMGFTIQHGEAGIRGTNISSTNIHDNIIRENGGFNSGIHIENNFKDGDFNNLTLVYRFVNNTISDNSGDGIYFDNYIYLYSAVDGLTIENTFANNTIQGNGGRGIYAESFLGTDADGGTVSNSTFSSIFTDNIIGGEDENGNGGHGILAISEIDIDDRNSSVSDVSISHSYERNQVSGNGGDGIRDEKLDITFYADGSDVSDVDLSTYLVDNVVLNNAGDGYFNEAIQVVNRREGILLENVTLTAEFVDNEFSGNGGAGIRSNEHAIMGGASSVSSSGFTDIYTGNTIERNGSDGIYLDSDFTGGADTYMEYRVVDNQINQNGGDGFYLYLDTRDGELIAKTVLLQGNSIMNNEDDGVEIYVNGDTPNDFSGDFGGGVLSSTGGNTFSGNGTYDIYHRGESLMDIWALDNNWTNDADPESTIYDVEDTPSAGDIISMPPL